MKKGIELRKIVTIVEFYDLEDLISKDVATNFIDSYCPNSDCYIKFRYTPEGYSSDFPEIERILREELEIAGSEIILIHFEF